MKAYKIDPGKGLHHYITAWPSEVLSFLEEDLESMMPNDTITIEIIEITEKEYINLPDFQGP
jgi:hypothetical protein